MILSEAVFTVENGALWSNSYKPGEVHRAIRTAGNLFVMETDCARSTTNVNTVASTATVNVTSTISGFRQEHLEYCRIGTKRLVPARIETILRWQNGDATAGEPDYFAFEANDSMRTFPIPNAIYAMAITHSPPFTSIDPGVTSGSTELNIPDEYIDGVLWWGASVLLVYGEAGTAYGRPEWQRFEEHIQSVRSKVHREPERDSKERQARSRMADRAGRRRAG